MAFLAGARVLYRAGLRRRRAHRLYRRGGGVREARPGVGCAGPTTTRRAGGDGWGGGGGPGDEKLKEETIWAHPLSQVLFKWGAGRCGSTVSENVREAQRTTTGRGP